ncbi:MAG: isoleucine--tRNA ligase [Candidatus Pacebacteria bacterium]|nr:isoleucine--tRNA ligase [Candidatus Paceibacterota bacterium]
MDASEKKTPTEGKTETSQREEAMLSFWNERGIFEKSVTKDAPKGEYVFYDGPPFATGLPHYGHIVASVIKDVVPRYFTMQGYSVPRRWGWDCHGLPIENIVEKELGTKRKKDIIEQVGIAKFNELCRSKVMTYADDWKKIIPRIGRWADMENPYFTMSPEFMESVWWVFKQLYDKKLVYEDYRSMHICPRCETTLSQGEVAEGYKMIKDLAVTVKFPLLDEPNTFVLAWTTTPWTLPGNVALAVHKDTQYVKVQHAHSGNVFIVAKERAAHLFNFEGNEYVLGETLSGNDLLGKKYLPPFDSYQNAKVKNIENAWKIYHADFITTDTGTGIAHEAPAFGAEDMVLAQEVGLPLISHVAMDGTIAPEVKELAGLSVKPINDPQATDVEVVKYLAGKGLLFAKEKYEHSYPHCWRCDTPLINYATSSWFVKVEGIKPTLLSTAENVNWSPAHVKEGRFGKWLEGARDWSISRQRFWASVIPLWRCGSCGKDEVFGSVAELKEKSGVEVKDLHKHVVDEVTYPCVCGGVMKRIPDVLDTWFDSGSMPYGEKHYPFEDKARFEKTYPAQFIAEGQDQTRAWFYYLHVLAGAVFEKNAFQNVIVNGIVLAEDGKKMSKKLQNYPDPMLVVEKYGADALRLYLMSSPVVRAENLNFSEEGVHEIARKVVDRVVNTYQFYSLFKDAQTHVPADTSEHVLDRWIVALLRKTHAEVTEAMERYELDRASRPLIDFMDDLSTWYVRRSRDRFKSDNAADVSAALSTLSYVLREYAKMSAPFTPFLSEWLWQEMKREGDAESVHLAAWSALDTSMPQEEVARLMQYMHLTRSIVSAGLEKRSKANIKVRQPLAKITVGTDIPALADEFGELIKDELNVKEVAFAHEPEKNPDAGSLTYAVLSVELDTALTPELLREGVIRDLLRAVQGLRKDMNLTPGQKVALVVSAEDAGKAIVAEAQAELLRVANVQETLFEELGDAGQVGKLETEGALVATFTLRT